MQNSYTCDATGIRGDFHIYYIYAYRCNQRERNIVVDAEN